MRLLPTREEWSFDCMWLPGIEWLLLSIPNMIVWLHQMQSDEVQRIESMIMREHMDVSSFIKVMIPIESLSKMATTWPRHETDPNQDQNGFSMIWTVCHIWVETPWTETTNEDEWWYLSMTPLRTFLTWANEAQMARDIWQLSMVRSRKLQHVLSTKFKFLPPYPRRRGIFWEFPRFPTFLWTSRFCWNRWETLGKSSRKIGAPQFCRSKPPAQPIFCLLMKGRRHKPLVPSYVIPKLVLLEGREPAQNHQDKKGQTRADNSRLGTPPVWTPPFTGAWLAGSSLKTATSLKKEVRPFFLGDNSIGVFPFFLPLAITAFGGPEGYFSLAIIAFGALEFIVPKYGCRLGKMESKESRLLIKEVTVFKEFEIASNLGI